nr:uncharacterized protein DKFZp434B061-like [Aegilops tauschii subsp. strangulata]
MPTSSPPSPSPRTVPGPSPPSASSPSTTSRAEEHHYGAPDPTSSSDAASLVVVSVTVVHRRTCRRLLLLRNHGASLCLRGEPAFETPPSPFISPLVAPPPARPSPGRHQGRELDVAELGQGQPASPLSSQDAAAPRVPPDPAHPRARPLGASRCLPAFVVAASGALLPRALTTLLSLPGPLCSAPRLVSPSLLARPRAYGACAPRRATTELRRRRCRCSAPHRPPPLAQLPRSARHAEPDRTSLPAQRTAAGIRRPEFLPRRAGVSRRRGRLI